MTQIDRRRLLQGAGGLAAASALGWPGLALARAATDKRFVVILQRGAQDGLSALVPYADPDYRDLRPRTFVPAPGEEAGALRLDGDFGLHPALGTFHALWQAGELACIPAIATRYRERSHFDGQNLLENGAGTPFAARDGFLNRSLFGLPPADHALGMALGHAVPLALQGEASIRTWAPSSLPSVDEDFLRRLQATYMDDPALGSALTEALDEGMEDGLSRDEARRVARGQEPALAAAAAAAALSEDDGPRIALIESEGWDTHYAQPARLGELFTVFDEIVATLKDGLAPVWDKTVIVTVSEFGRTARENGSIGTDHGTGGTSFVLGGAVRGGRIAGDWPGLSTSALYEGRDVAPANATEALLMAVFLDHLGMDDGFVRQTVLPGTDDIRPMARLFR